MFCKWASDHFPATNKLFSASHDSPFTCVWVQTMYTYVVDSKRGASRLIDSRGQNARRVENYAATSSTRESKNNRDEKRGTTACFFFLHIAIDKRASQYRL